MIDDLDRIMAVMTAAFDPEFGEAWTRRQVEDALLIPGTRYLLAGPDGASPPLGVPAAGFTLSRAIAGEEELLLLAVSPAFRGRGVGWALLQRLLKTAEDCGVQRVFLEMRDGNQAVSLYRRAGFHDVGRRPNYYRKGTGVPRDAITFSYQMNGGID